MDIDTDTGLETKDGLPVESVVTHAEMMRAFEEFKQANDARTSHMERCSADALLEEKLTRIDRTSMHTGGALTRSRSRMRDRRSATAM